MPRGTGRFIIPVTGKYFERVTIPAVSGDIEVQIEVHVVSVRIPALNEKVATEMADSVIRKLVREKRTQ